MNAASREDLEFVVAFEECRLTAAEFGHCDHLRVAYVYLTQHPIDDAFSKMERGLQHLLTHLGAPPSKFHVTLTRAWLLAVQHFMLRTGATKSFAEFVADAGSSFLDAAIMQTHYSRERLFSNDARVRFLAPDLQQIPQHPD